MAAERVPAIDKYCIWCGKPFQAYLQRAATCSVSCQQRTWVSRAMLAGTHGYIDHQFTRLPMHVHPRPTEPGATPAYCAEHAPEDEIVDECGNERHVCVICEEAALNDQQVAVSTGETGDGKG